MTDGAFTHEYWNEDDGSTSTLRWESAADLAEAFWHEQSLPTLDEQVGPAWECVNYLVGVGDPRSLGVLDHLVELAPDEDALFYVGAGPLEDLMQDDIGPQFIDEIETRARQSQAFRTAVSGLWLGRGVDAGVRTRLAKFGATLLNG